MKSILFSLAVYSSSAILASALVKVDEDVFGTSLGGWKKKDKLYVDYPLSGANYRTYKPEISPTPDGGIFVSLRIDYLRGWLASDDHAVLEITYNSKGLVLSAQSNIALQGVSVSSDLILGSNDAGKQLGPTDRAVQVGSDLISNLSAKLLRENIVEAGRVSFPAVIRHNYNLLFQAVRLDGKPVQVAPVEAPAVAPIPTPGSPLAVPPAASPPVPVAPPVQAPGTIAPVPVPGTIAPVTPVPAPATPVPVAPGSAAPPVSPPSPPAKG